MYIRKSTRSTGTYGSRVTSGLRPQLDGLDWLQAHGYRTVLHIRAPGEDDTADRRQVEKRVSHIAGMRQCAIDGDALAVKRDGGVEIALGAQELG